MFAFQGRVAVVTGSSRGIGLATARLLARAGAAVVVSSRHQAACESIRDELIGRGTRALAVAAHVGREADCANLIQTTVSAFGRLDILVVNAAVNPVFATLATLPEAAWQKVLQTNLTGSWCLARHALPNMAAGGGGAAVFVSSINARLGVARAGAYGISKAAIEQLTRQLAVEWGPSNVRVNAVAPGTINTDMIRELARDPQFLARASARTPLKRIGTADEVAAAIVFLASEAASHITGQVLAVDGGETIQRTEL
jgi:dehydrogenase/reductase SDR family member 4